MQRCGWVSQDPLYIAYHDKEWGVPETDSNKLFEMICLEGQQAGLSWITVLKKRENYRQAFHQFDPVKVAAMTARRSWQLTLNNDIKLNLGRGDTMKRLQRFMELYPVLQQQAQTDGKRISYVDLRYDSGAAVGWVPAPVEETQQQQNQAQAEQQ